MSELRCDIVAYHYVYPPEPQPLPRYHGPSIDEFARQLDMLEETHEIVSLREYLERLEVGPETGPRNERPLCVLSFDDGLRQHAEAVVPVLLDRGLSGAFFLITGVMEDETVAGVHMLHLLLATLEIDELVERLTAVGSDVDPEFEGRFHAVCEELAAGDPSGRYYFDAPRTAALKKLLNYELPEERRNRLLRPVLLDAVGPEEEVSRELYLDWDQAREMSAAGMCVGGHSHGHAMLSRLADEQIVEDLERCRHLLEDNLGAGAFPFCYPYGNRVAVDERVATATAAAGYTCGLTVLKGTNGPDADRYWLRRRDTIEMGRV